MDTALINAAEENTPDFGLKNTKEIEIKSTF